MKNKTKTSITVARDKVKLFQLSYCIIDLAYVYVKFRLCCYPPWAFLERGGGIKLMNILFIYLFCSLPNLQGKWVYVLEISKDV